MTNNLLPFDPLKAKNGDVVIFEPRDNDVTFVGMYNGYAFCAGSDGHVLPYATSHLRLRPRMVKRKIDIFANRTWSYADSPLTPTGERLHITTIEIEVPEG